MYSMASRCRARFSSGAKSRIVSRAAAGATPLASTHSGARTAPTRGRARRPCTGEAVTEAVGTAGGTPGTREVARSRRALHGVWPADPAGLLDHAWGNELWTATRRVRTLLRVGRRPPRLSGREGMRLCVNVPAGRIAAGRASRPVITDMPPDS